MNKIALTLPMIMAATAWGAEQTNAPTRFDFPSFNIIAERNIFNMNRSGRRPYSPPERETERRPVRTETFALVGTMSYEKGLFAFFEGSGSQYSQVLKPSDTIAGFTIAAVTPTSVKLSSTNGNSLELPVGMQLKRQDDGEWTLSERTDIARNYASSSSSGSRMSNSPSTDAGPEDGEALRRLMQRREQEGGAPETASAENNAASEPAAVQEPKPETTEKPETVEKPDSGTNGGADDILKRLMEKREQEINK